MIICFIYSLAYYHPNVFMLFSFESINNKYPVKCSVFELIFGKGYFFKKKIL